MNRSPKSIAYVCYCKWSVTTILLIYVTTHLTEVEGEEFFTDLTPFESSSSLEVSKREREIVSLSFKIVLNVVSLHSLNF